jgi:uncharacterized protein YcfL
LTEITVKITADCWIKKLFTTFITLFWYNACQQHNLKIKNMKKLILLSALLIAGITVNAQTATRTQQAPDASAKATKQTENLDKVVSLTAPQKEKVQAINLSKNTAVNAAASNKTTFEANRSKINAEREAEIAAVLTPEQLVKFNKAKSDKKAANTRK